MIDTIVRWSLGHRLLVGLASVALLVWGGVQTLRMPVDVFPDLTAPTVTIVAEAHGMPSEEVEILITRPIEVAVNGATGIRRIRSSTSVGSAIIWVDFEWGTDIYRARQTVAEKLQLARSDLPPDLPSPVLAPITSIMGEILFAALKSDQHSAMEVKAAADWKVRRRLLAVPGVSKVLPIGGDTKQYQIIVRPDRLAAYGIPLSVVVDVARGTNLNSSAGFFVDGGQEYLIRGLGRTNRLDELATTAVAERNGIPVLLRDLADVKIGAALKRGEGSHNGKPAVIIGIQKQPGVNTLELTKKLDLAFAELESSLSKGMRFETNIFRQATFIERAIDNLMEALRDGAILVVLIVGAFLFSARATLITLLAIPLSVLAAIVAMKSIGATINTMTLGGLAIALGALVDDAIIVVENIARRLRENGKKSKRSQKPVMEVVEKATSEIQGSIVFATLIIILVFVPLFFLQGVEGRLMEPLGFAYVVSLAASLLVAVTITPALASVLLPGSSIVKHGQETWLVRVLKRIYRPVVQLSLKLWPLIAGISIAVFVVALYFLFSMGRSFLPEFNEGSLTVSAIILPGSSLEESDKLAGLAEKILLSEPEVIATARRTGRSELDEHAQPVNASEIDVTLKMADRSKEEVLASLRAKLAGLPGMNVVIGQPISHRIDHMLSGTRANIAVKIFGPDLFELRRLAQQAKAAISDVSGLVDLTVEQQTNIPLVTMRFNREAIAHYGLSVKEVAEAVETAFAGHEVSRVLEGEATYDLVVRYPREGLRSIDDVKEATLVTKSGATVPIEVLADIHRDDGPNVISRENAQRKIVVSGNVADRDLLSVVDDVRDRIAKQLALPANYRVEYGGQFESAVEATRRLSILTVLAIVGTFVLLFTAFSSARDALLVMLNLPLALVGGVAGVYFSGGILSIASIIGFVTLFGIATRNGVMLVTHIRHLLTSAEETDLRLAIVRGAEERLVPILMTALATALALVPIAMSAGQPGSEIQAPMALVILFGLLSSTGLNMIVVPALYWKFGGLRAGLVTSTSTRAKTRSTKRKAA